MVRYKISQWTREADVVVVGYGVSGAVAAITAHDAGAEVLLCEKGPYPGGLALISGGNVMCLRDVELGVAYLSGTSGGRVDPSLIRPFAEALCENEAYLKELARVNKATVRAAGHLLGGRYPFPGWEAFYSVRVSDIPGFQGFPWAMGGWPQGPKLAKLVIENVEARGIPTLLHTPVRRLVTNEGGAVIGVLAERDGQEMSIRARKAVILACGGFEQNDWLKMQYVQGLPVYSCAPLTHTGDGIFMAQSVGAALGHMWFIHANYGFKFPEYPTTFSTLSTVATGANLKVSRPFILVDKFGRRYMSEVSLGIPETYWGPMELLDPTLPGYPRLPSYLIFDEKRRLRGPMAIFRVIGEDRYEWSEDNSREVERGWIMKGDSLRELAGKIRETPGNGGHMEADVLEATLAQWNEIVKAAKDPFGRPSGTMVPIQTPPFYAIETCLSLMNTQGGPLHNALQQVLTPYNEPIPHLYAVGELGSFFSHLYIGGGNLGECLTSGRIAGKAGAQETPLD